MTSLANALTHVTLFDYDDNNFLTNQAVLNITTNRFLYSTNGLMLASFDGLSNSNTFTYNEFAQVLTQTDPRGFVTVNDYDLNTGNLLATTNALGTLDETFTLFTYDDRGLLTSQKDALGNLTTYRYDALGNLTNVVVLDSAQMSVLGSRKGCGLEIRAPSSVSNVLGERRVSAVGERGRSLE